MSAVTLSPGHPGPAAPLVTTPRNARPYFKRHPNRHVLGARSAAAGGPYTVPAICAAYGWPTNLPGGGTIAIVELGGGWVASDMAAFFKSIGQPVPTIIDVSVDGTTNSPGQDADVEVALDIQVAAAGYYLATKQVATIRVYWSQDIASAMAAATKDGCDVCSISWGADEASWGSGGCQQTEQTAITSVAAGMVVLAAAGDNDSSDGGPTPANVDCPASCPHILACGGTTKTAASEVVWNNDPPGTDSPSGEGTGGGYSTVFPVQSWQIGVPTAPSGLGRMVPDVAADADPTTGYEIFVGGSAQVIGGTSAVAPLYAGLLAACGKKLGFVTPKLFANQSAFVDITQGSNGVYTAGPGPDPCTGIGAPRASMIAALLTAAAPAPQPPTDAPTLAAVQAAIRAKLLAGRFALLTEQDAANEACDAVAPLFPPAAST